ncbi:hypothetical protein B0H16DRAFT_1557646 [Mycena metata]|uniref:Uncharacterized protein n=1 Tax=Mycena metata TaxID=1033252 RepID=A0AAD7IPC8_9AGAR|nr:hypothetical protein B0H16DRAFT_1557646 [Mycena metata]
MEATDRRSARGSGSRSRSRRGKERDSGVYSGVAHIASRICSRVRGRVRDGATRAPPSEGAGRGRVCAQRRRSLFRASRSRRRSGRCRRYHLHLHFLQRQQRQRQLHHQRQLRHHHHLVRIHQLVLVREFVIVSGRGRGRLNIRASPPNCRPALVLERSGTSSLSASGVSGLGTRGRVAMLGNFHLPALLLPRRHCEFSARVRVGVVRRRQACAHLPLCVPRNTRTRKRVCASPYGGYSRDGILPSPPSSSASSSVFDLGEHGDGSFR